MTLPLPFWLVVENRNPRPQLGWTTVGLPDSLPAVPLRISRPQAPGWFGEIVADPVDRRAMHLRAKCEAMERFWAVVEQETAPVARGYQPHPWVTDDLAQLIPYFLCVDENGIAQRSNGMTLVGPGEQLPDDFIVQDKNNAAMARFHMRTRIVPLNLTIEGWWTIWHDDPAVEFDIRATYGTTAPGQPRERVMGPLSMIVGEEPHLDWRVRKGLHMPMWRADLGAWEAELMVQRSLMRARTVEARGALLCTPSKILAADVLQPSAVTDLDALNRLLARRDVPIGAQLDKTLWDGRLGSLSLALPGPWAANEQGRRANSMDARLQTPADYFETRPYAQPPNSGQTGEQPDFGATRAEHAVSFQEPWALFDLRYSAEAWLARPYANREPNGSPVLAANHTGCVLYNRLPDYHRTKDSLGWPLPVGWISSYTTSDTQHRSDNLLYHLFALTRDPSLERTIRDTLELDRMELDQGDPAPGGGVGAPRALGRTLVSWCHAMASGFPEFEPFVRRAVHRANIGAAYKTLPPTTLPQVRPLSSTESKYGYNNPPPPAGDGQPIRCWLPWQEGIATMGLYAAWRMLAIPEARDLAIVAAANIANWGWFQDSTGRWRYCYAVRWRTDIPGEPLPASSYNLNQPNYDVFVTGDTARWVMSALKILVELQPQAPAADRARAILAGVQSKNWDDACWFAAVP